MVNMGCAICSDDGPKACTRLPIAMAPSSTSVPERLRADLKQVLQLALVGVLVGLACWPLNLVDHWQDLLLQRLPAFNGGSWNPALAIQACVPLIVMPVLLALQARPWREGSGSGIPQAMLSVETPEQAATLMSPSSTVKRLSLWSIASLALLSLGREGPVVQVGGAVAQALRSRWPGLLARIPATNLLAVSAGAGLAGGFNAPLMGVVFVAEELCGRFGAQLIWPALVICAVAAEVSNLGGQPQFTLGLVHLNPQEIDQIKLGVGLGVCAGAMGGLFARLLFESTRRLIPRAQQHPWRSGLLLGGLLSLLLVLSGGNSGGDGEALMAWMLADPLGHHVSVGDLVGRLIGPCLSLGAGIPGGLIDPALTIGAVTGQLISDALQLGSLGIAIGMAAGLAGATQLPVMSLVFALHMAGDQQLLTGIMVASVIGAYTGRLWMMKPIYHALTDLLQERRGVLKLEPNQTT
jgi:H+/Cl- antiporter ClcA